MASNRHHGEPAQRPARLYLVATLTGDNASGFLRNLVDACAAGDIAAVLLRLPDSDERTLINSIKTIASRVQEPGPALLLDGRPDLVARANADGAHLSGIDDFRDAVASLKPDRIAGCGDIHSRHDAMLAAESGADYLMFGEPDAHDQRPALDAVVERVAWWTEVFEIPCVAYAGSLDEIAPLAAAGAEFIAIGDWIFDDPRGAELAVRDAMGRLAVGEKVG